MTLSLDIERISSSPGWLGLSEIFEMIKKRIRFTGGKQAKVKTGLLHGFYLFIFLVPFGNSLLTEGIFANDGFRSRAGLAKAHVILCDDTELIFCVRNKASDRVHGGGDLGFVVSDPLVSGRLLAFNVVACNSRATIIFRSRP